MTRRRRSPLIIGLTVLAFVVPQATKQGGCQQDSQDPSTPGCEHAEPGTEGC